MPKDRIESIKSLMLSGVRIRETARQVGAGAATVQRSELSVAGGANTDSVKGGDFTA
jgi:hypothetical protein